MRYECNVGREYRKIEEDELQDKASERGLAQYVSPLSQDML